MTEGEQRFERLIEGLRSGDPRVVEEFCRQYAPRVERVAQKHLPRGLQRRVSAEDVSQSAFRTFLRRAQGGEFQLADSEKLWRLMCAITLAKVREQTRFHLRQKRGIDQEAHGPMPEGDSSGDRFAPADSAPTPGEAAEFADQFRQLMDALEPEERQVVDLKLQECDNETIAERLNCSERTVQRILKRAQARIFRAFDPER